ncbi:protein Bouncer-like [Onychostoma macrolepis]|uniref:Snake toxin/toxin-like domain-containing protein n=1 Tax=Onychostoma macrolepis TaxID=369639 RepID=A0A7J6C3C1_9TELE|nr:protein Bouncer-like [Onychostoma macrolepis]KAF4101777.1 hypothetical protein G5714_018209 [Onychostoma macrolepis]
MDSGSVALRSAVLALVVLLSGRAAAAVLLCHYCPLQAAGARCNITTECRGHERCSSGWRRYGRVHVLALQGCASPTLCGSNQTLTHKGLEYEITYTCCCRDLCNTAAAPENLLQQLLGVTVSPPDPPSCSEL